MPTYIETYSQVTPDGGDDLSQGDDVIRQGKRCEQERDNEDHVRPADETGITTVGYHRKSQYIEQASDPTPVANTGMTYVKDDGGDTELYYQDDGGSVVQITKDGALNLTAAALLAIVGPVIYPIGTVLTFGVSTNPNTLLGFGTWAAIAGKVIVGLDGAQTEFDTLDETGGAKTHTLTTAEMPAHTHSYTDESSLVAGSNPGSGATQATQTKNTGSTGGGGAHNNLQPYIVKYVWQRTA